jgi:hypothetical protein
LSAAGNPERLGELDVQRFGGDVADDEHVAL